MSVLRLVREWVQALEPIESVIQRESLARLAFPPRRSHLDAIADNPGCAHRDDWSHHVREWKPRTSPWLSKSNPTFPKPAA